MRLVDVVGSAAPLVGAFFGGLMAVRRRLVRHYERRAAFGPESAIAPLESRFPLTRWWRARLRTAQVIGALPDGREWLDAQRSGQLPPHPSATGARRGLAAGGVATARGVDRRHASVKGGLHRRANADAFGLAVEPVQDRCEEEAADRRRSDDRTQSRECQQEDERRADGEDQPARTLGGDTVDTDTGVGILHILLSNSLRAGSMHGSSHPGRGVRGLTAVVAQSRKKTLRRYIHHNTSQINAKDAAPSSVASKAGPRTWKGVRVKCRTRAATSGFSKASSRH